MTSFPHTSEIVIETCINCGLEFGLTRAFRNQRKRDGELFNCPNGHRQRFTETEEDRLRRKLEDAERRIDSLSRECNSTREHRDCLRRRLSAMRGVATKLRNQLGATT